MLLRSSDRVLDKRDIIRNKILCGLESIAGEQNRIYFLVQLQTSNQQHCYFDANHYRGRFSYFYFNLVLQYDFLRPVWQSTLVAHDAVVRAGELV